MKNQTIFFLFILGFVLWYANRKKVAASPVLTTGPTSVGSSSGGGVQSVVSSGTTTAVIPTGMTDGVPNWLNGLGFSWDAGTHEGSFWLDSKRQATTIISLATGSLTGQNWQTDTPYLSQLITLGRWTGVQRINPTVNAVNGVGGTGGIPPNTTFYAKVINPLNTNESITVRHTTGSVSTAQIVVIPLNPVVKPAITNGIIDILKKAGFSWDAGTHEGSFWVQTTKPVSISISPAAGTLSGIGFESDTAYMTETPGFAPWTGVQRINPTVNAVNGSGGTGGIPPNSTFYATITTIGNSAERTTLKVVNGNVTTAGIIDVPLVSNPKPTVPVVVPVDTIPPVPTGTRPTNIEYADNNPGGGAERMSDVAITWSTDGKSWTMSGGILPGAGGDYKHYFLVDGEGLAPAKNKSYSPHDGPLSDFGPFLPNTHVTIHNYVAKGPVFGNLINGENGNYKKSAGYVNIYVGTKP